MYGMHGFTHTHGFSVMICLRVRLLLVNYNFVLHNVSCTLHTLFQLFSDMFPLLILGCGWDISIVGELNEYRSNFETSIIMNAWVRHRIHAEV